MCSMGRYMFSGWICVHWVGMCKVDRYVFSG